MRREVKAHIEVPVGGSLTLCGQPAQKIRACPGCVAKRAAMALVHIQSPKGGHVTGSLCGRELLESSSDGKVQVSGRTEHDYFRSKFVRGVPPPAYVSADTAREILRGGGGGEISIPMCPACCVNLGRLDEAESARRSSAVAVHRPRARSSPVAGLAMMQPEMISEGED